MLLRPALAISLLLAAPLAAQAHSPQADLHDEWKPVSAFLLASAQQVPEASYAFKPVATVRSFGQLVAHVAGSQHMFCAAAMGEKSSAENDIEKQTLTKTQLVAALQASNDYCARAYAMDPALMTSHVELFGMKMSPSQTLILNAMHDDEHYGNMVTYMRIMGMVPPSSQPAK